MNEEKNKVEAILFTTGRFLGLEEISRLCGIGSLGYLKELLEELEKDYKEKANSLEISRHGEKWKLNIRKEYLHLTESLLTDCELDRPTQETLAIIAYKSPVFQSEVTKIRGSTAYDHIKTLKEMEFITSEKSGRTRLLKVTGKFYDYFDVVEDQLQSKFDELGEKQVEVPEEAKQDTRQVTLTVDGEEETEDYEKDN